RQGWIEADNTEHGIVPELVQAGIPKSDMAMSIELCPRRCPPRETPDGAPIPSFQPGLEFCREVCTDHCMGQVGILTAATEIASRGCCNPKGTRDAGSALSAAGAGRLRRRCQMATRIARPCLDSSAVGTVT